MGSKILYLLLGLFCSVVFFTSAALADTVLDQFSSIDYGNNDGTVPWASDWEEINESDGANAGDIRVTGGELRVQDNNGGGEGVSREVDLLGATSATLSFYYRRNRLDDANDYVTISVSANGGVSWTELDSFAGPTNDAGNQSSPSYDISGYVAANTMIRFLSSPYLGANDRVYFDDVQIDFTKPANPTAISRVSTNPSTAGTAVDWLVTFDQAVTGVDATDFTLVEAGGTSGATILSVTGSGTSWTVTADTGTSDTGTLGLNLVDDDSILNAASLPLGGAGAGNGDFVGEVYTLIPPAPVLGKTASAYGAALGDMVSFTITATNPYAFDLTNVVITDTLPAGMNYVTHLASMGSADNSGQDVVWTIPTLPAGGSAKLDLAVSLTQTGSLTNTVTAPGSTAAGATVQVFTSGAITHFRMDETVGSWDGTAGEVIDTGGTDLHGRRLTSNPPTTTNVIDPLPTIDSQYPSVVGQFCNSGSFDGRAVVEVADSSLFDYSTQFSASVWVYPTAYPPSDFYSILSNDVNYEFHINNTGKLYWWWNNGQTLTSDTSIPLNRWTHIAITFDSSIGRQRIYINGVQDDETKNWQGNLVANNCNFYIGGDVATGSCSIMPARNFRGRIDEVKLYAFELSAEEVVADMTRGRSCSGTFDHIRIEHDGNGSICYPEKVKLKACFNADCTALFPGKVTVNLSPSGWVGGNTLTFSGGIASAQLGIATPGDVTLGTNSVVPTPAGTTRCFNGASETCNLNFSMAASCNFDAVETGATPQTPIFTKLANTSFALDVLVLLDATTLNTGYTGTVAVDLVDSSTTNCPTGTGLVTAQDISFAAADAGRKNVVFASNRAAPNVRVRATLGASAPACSADNFAIRPPAFTLSSNDATNTSTSGTPVIKAGAAFHLSAAAVIGYNGIPTIDTNGLTGTPNDGVLSGVFSAATAGDGIASGIGFSYSEVGHFGLAANVVFDADFTLFDQPDECLVGFSNSLSAGKYGCSIGSTEVPFDVDSSGFGRFIPARFNVSTNTPILQPACNSTFTYLGQPFGYSTSPQLTLTARNVVGNTTSNYGGDYWKHNSGLLGHSYTSNVTGIAAPIITTMGSVAWSGTTDSNGVGQASLSGEFLTYTKPASSVAPFEADVNLTFSVDDLKDSDDVCYDPDNNGICNSFTISNITDNITGSDQRYGRMRLQNAYGPETLPLTIPVFTEYFDGTSFVLNDSDSCTTYDSSNIQLTNFQYNLEDDKTFAQGGNNVLVSGVGNNLSLTAPGDENDGSVDVTLDLSQAPGAQIWLQPGGINPTTRATFGIYRGNDRLIYMRESIW
jgi:uncharacterized repeat protein (TIGR01451 family)